MKRKETISIEINDILDCVNKKMFEEYPYLKDDDVVEVNLVSNTKFLLFEVIRKKDLTHIPDAIKSEK